MTESVLARLLGVVPVEARLVGTVVPQDTCSLPSIPDVRNRPKAI